MSPERGLGSILATILLLIGVATLLAAVLLALTTTVGWPKLTLTAILIVTVAMLFIAREMRTPS
jgi:uncharacterized membrane protein YphA (DoxX/SURF4 family)